MSSTVASITSYFNIRQLPTKVGPTTALGDFVRCKITPPGPKDLQAPSSWVSGEIEVLRQIRDYLPGYRKDITKHGSKKWLDFLTINKEVLAKIHQLVKLEQEVRSNLIAKYPALALFPTQKLVIEDIIRQDLTKKYNELIASLEPNWYSNFTTLELEQWLFNSNIVELALEVSSNNIVATISCR